VARYFRPPTHPEPFAGPNQDRLFSRVTYPRGNTVFKNADGSIDPSFATQPGYTDITQAQVLAIEAAGGRAYLGGGVHLLTSAEETALTAAGYGAFISSTPP
jgi:hypothetical protein